MGKKFLNNNIAWQKCHAHKVTTHKSIGFMPASKSCDIKLTTDSFTHPFVHVNHPWIQIFTIYPFTLSFTHPATHSPVDPFTHSFIHLTIYPPSIHSPNHPSSTIPFIHPFTHKFTHLFTHPSIKSPIHLFTYPSVHPSLFVPSIHSPIHPLSIHSPIHLSTSQPSIHSPFTRSSIYPPIHPPCMTIHDPSSFHQVIHSSIWSLY